LAKINKNRLVFRHLEYRRTDDLVDKLEKFVKVCIKFKLHYSFYKIKIISQCSIGKKYKVSPGKLLKKKSGKSDEIDNNDSRTFFCSELVGAAFK
jgi:hypothetical protein